MSVARSSLCVLSYKILTHRYFCSFFPLIRRKCNPIEIFCRAFQLLQDILSASSRECRSIHECTHLQRPRGTAGPRPSRRGTSLRANLRRITDTISSQRGHPSGSTTIFFLCSFFSSSSSSSSSCKRLLRVYLVQAWLSTPEKMNIVSRSI